MRIPYYQIDAFITSKPFSGNPAGVCLLDEWPPDDILQHIAAENNLSETAFIVENDNRFNLRWFTPTMEIDLCGHATLAPAFLILTQLKPDIKQVVFNSRSGELIARKSSGMIELDFPARPPEICVPPEGLIDSIGFEPTEVYLSRDYLLIYETEEQVRSLKPDMAKLAQIDCFAVIASAKGIQHDFVSRFFAPGGGVPEDHVTGSAHCTLIPFWAERLAKNDLHAFQLSKRGGELFCKNLGDRVTMAGRCHMYLEGTIII